MGTGDTSPDTLDENPRPARKPFDPDATIDESNAPRRRDFDATQPTAAPQLDDDPFGGGGGDRTILDPLPAPVKDALPEGRRLRPRPKEEVDADPGATVEQKRPDWIRPCPHCKQIIDARNVLCPSCRKPTGKKAINASLVALIAGAGLILLVLYFVWDWLGTPTPPPPAP